MHLLGTQHPGKGGTGPPLARGTDGTQLLQTHAWTEERCPKPRGAQGHAAGSTEVPSRLTGASPSCPTSPAPRMLAPGSGDPQPSPSRAGSAPATLRHRSVPCSLPACLRPCPRPCRRDTATAFGKSPIHSTRAPCRPGRQHLRAGAGRNTPPLPPGRGGGTTSTGPAGDATYAEEHQYVCARRRRGGQRGQGRAGQGGHRRRRGRRFLLGQKKVIA